MDRDFLTVCLYGPNRDIPILTLQEKPSLEGEMTLAEASFALKNMKKLQKSWLRRFYSWIFSVLLVAAGILCC